MITSISNPKIQHVRELLARSKKRRKAQAFVVEGIRLIDESRRFEIRPKFALFTEGLSVRGEQLCAELVNDGVDVYGYFNYHFAGHSPASVRQFAELLGQELHPG